MDIVHHYGELKDVANKQISIHDGTHLQFVLIN